MASSRRRQEVSRKIDRRDVTAWMIQEVEHCGSDLNIASKDIDQEQFRYIFRNYDKKRRRANRKKASRWWHGRHEYTQSLNSLDECLLSVTTKFTHGNIIRKRYYTKAMPGRGNRLQGWVEFVHSFLDYEFERMIELGVKVTRKLLWEAAVTSITEEDSPLDPQQVDPASSLPIIDMVTMEFVKRYCLRKSISIHRTSGNLSRSPEHRMYTEKLIAYHLGRLSIEFNQGLLDENRVENMDETYFQVDMDNKLRLAPRGSRFVPNYKEFVAGGEGITLVLRMTGGIEAKLCTPFFIFRNSGRNYPIAGTPDNIDGVCYRTQPRAWMDRQTFEMWLKEERAIDVAENEHQRILFLDNAAGHGVTNSIQEAMNELNTLLRKLPPNTTHLCQPLDNFIIKVFRDLWMKAWDQEKKKRIEDGNYRQQSGRVNRPHRHWYMMLARDCDNEINEMKDANGNSFCRKAMVRCGLSKDFDGIWRIEQLSPPLQKIYNENIDNFNGTMPENPNGIVEGN